MYVSKIESVCERARRGFFRAQNSDPVFFQHRKYKFLYLQDRVLRLLVFGSIWKVLAVESGVTLERNPKVPFKCQFYDVFLRVGVTKYCKLQYKLLPGSATAASHPALAPYQHRENTKCKHCLGKY